MVTLLSEHVIAPRCSHEVRVQKLMRSRYAAVLVVFISSGVGGSAGSAITPSGGESNQTSLGVV